MIKKHTLHLISIIPVFYIVFGCITPEPVVITEVVTEVVTETRTVEVIKPPDTLMPLTGSILLRLNEDNKLQDNIKMYQFILFGRIILEREYTESSDSLESGVAQFVNTHVREHITINDQTAGQALLIEIIEDDIVLSLCFEEDDKFQLIFSAPLSDQDTFYSLVYDTNDSLHSASDERGVLDYGGEKYKVKFSGDRSPYLLIKLSQSDTDKLTSRIAPGRQVNSNR